MCLKKGKFARLGGCKPPNTFFEQNYAWAGQETQIAVKAMQEHERRSFPFHLVMNTDSLIGGVWHTHPSPQYQMVQHVFFFYPKTEDGT
jgi:hypothetical protein